MPRYPVAFNGKFLASAPTGVHRVAEQLILHLDRLLCHAGTANADNWTVIGPRNTKRGLSLQTIGQRTAGLLTWQAWEQFELPLLARHQVLVNLCNLAPLRHARSVTMIHDAQVFITPDSYSRAFRTWYQFALPKLGRSSKKILTVSEFSKRMLVKYGVAEADNIEIIPNGVDHLSDIEPDTRALAKLELKPRGYVVALANAQPHKNIKILLSAFQDLRLMHLRLVLVGRAAPAEFQEGGLSIPSNVTFAGFVSDAEMRALVENALCLAFPSTTEGFGLPPLEAMSLGCPAVVAPCGALPEVCAGGAVYAAPHQADEWVEAFLRLSEDTAYWEVQSNQGRARASDYSWSASASRLLTILNNLDQGL